MDKNLKRAPALSEPLPAHLSYLNPFLVADLIRFGDSGDGGYLLPESIVKRIDAVLSFGLSTDWSFEARLAQVNPAIPIHIYDHTVDAKSFRRAAKNAFFKFLGGKTSLSSLKSRWHTYTDYKRFFSGQYRHYRERMFNRLDNTNDATLEVAFARLGNARHVLLKMDIEGGEYRVLPALDALADRIDLLIVEFHDTCPLRAVFESQLRELLEHFAIIHLHGNNIAGVAADGLPEALEITLLNKRYPLSDRRRDALPVHGLDQPNDPHKPDYVLRFVRAMS